MKLFYEKYIMANLWFHILTLASIILIATSFIVPPTGVIDPSVLGATGELFAFAALWTVIKAIDKGSDIKLSKGNLSVELDNDREDERKD